MAAYPPTRRQADLLRFVAGHIEASGGVSPSLDECRTALGLRNNSSVHNLMAGLEERGLIQRIPNRARAVEVLHAPRLPRSPDGAPLYFVPLHSIGVAHG